jgi:hypothetical protein
MLINFVQSKSAIRILFETLMNEAGLKRVVALSITNYYVHQVGKL